MIIANWKMNGSRQSINAWIEEVSRDINIINTNPCIFCPPTCYLEHARKLINANHNRIKLGSQIVNYSYEGESLTGGINATMLKDFSVEYVLIGHSEQRNILKESNDVITKKIKRAKTDSELGLEFGNPSRPEADNLLTIYSIISGLGREKAAEYCSEMGWGKFKPEFTEAMINILKPIQEKYKELMNDPEELKKILNKGKLTAEEVSKLTLKRVKDALGFYSTL